MIGIAIPVFSGQLENAKLQTDHANIRSAYAMVMSANMSGTLYVGPEGSQTVLDVAKASTNKTLYFGVDGALSEDANNAYTLKAKEGNTDDCKATAYACIEDPDTIKHKLGAKIVITLDSTAHSVKLDLL